MTKWHLNKQQAFLEGTMSFGQTKQKGSKFGPNYTQHISTKTLYQLSIMVMEG